MYQYMQPNMMARKTEVLRVQGKAGAEAFAMMPNSEAALFDMTAPIVYLAQTDSAGYKTLKPFSITEYVPQPEPSLSDIESRLSRLEEMLNEQSVSERSESE